MKNYLRFLSPVMLLLMAVMFGGGKIYAQKTVSLTLSSSDMFGESSGLTLKQNDVTWKVTTNNNNGPINGYNTDYKGQQFGTGKKTWKGTFSTSDIVGKITKIDVAANTGGAASLSVKVGNTDFLSSGKATVNVAKKLNGINTYTFEGNATGDVVISLNGSSKACYLGGITVTYMEDDGKTQTTLSFPTSSYTYELGQDNGTAIIDDNAAVLKDKEGNVIDATGKITYSVESSVQNLADLGDNNGKSSEIIVNTNTEGTATVTATFAGDDTYAASKASYTINVINVIKSIADLKQQLDNNDKTFTLKLTDAVVSYVYKDRAYLEDASAGILVYLEGKQTLVAGQKFNGLVEVKAKTWYSLPEITSWAPFTSMTTETVTELPLHVVTVEELNNNYDKYEGCRVKVLGATVSKAFSNKNGEITQNGSSITLRAGDTNINATRNDIVNVIGFPSVYEAKTRTIQLAIWEKSAIEVIKTETLTTSAGGYATYSADYAVNYSDLGLTAYTLTVDETNKTVTAQAFMGVVPAGGAVLVKGDASKAYTLTPATTEGDATFVTALQTGATTANGTQYGFTSKSGTPAFAQVKSGQDIPAKKGYIVLKGASAAKYSICFDDEATGIQTIEAASAANAAMYNLAGQRVDKAYKGIVIVNGKKYLNK